MHPSARYSTQEPVLLLPRMHLTFLCDSVGNFYNELTFAASPSLPDKSSFSGFCTIGCCLY